MKAIQQSEKEGKWLKLADSKTIQETVEALKKNNIEAFSVKLEEAKAQILSLIPEGAEIMNMTSVTLDSLGISKEILKSGKYKAVKNELIKMDRDTQNVQMRKLGSAPEYAIGSVHAVTQDGNILIASNTGSQLPAYAYGSAKVIFVVGTHKIVKNTDEGIKRIYEHSLPLESERAKIAYGVPGSAVNKVLIINKEAQPGRIKLIFVNSVLGF